MSAADRLSALLGTSAPAVPPLVFDFGTTKPAASYSPPSAVSRASASSWSTTPRASPFAHLFAPKGSSEKPPRPTSSRAERTASASSSASLFAEFGVSAPRATQRTSSEVDPTASPERLGDALERVQLEQVLQATWSPTAAAQKPVRPSSSRAESPLAPSPLARTSSPLAPAPALLAQAPSLLAQATSYQAPAPAPARRPAVATAGTVAAVFAEPGSLGLSFISAADDLSPRVNDIVPGTQASRHTQITRGMVLVAVAGESVRSRRYEDCIDLIRFAKRPLELQFEHEPAPKPADQVWYSDTMEGKGMYAPTDVLVQRPLSPRPLSPQALSPRKTQLIDFDVVTQPVAGTPAQHAWRPARRELGSSPQSDAHVPRRAFGDLSAADPDLTPRREPQSLPQPLPQPLSQPPPQKEPGPLERILLGLAPSPEPEPEPSYEYAAATLSPKAAHTRQTTAAVSPQPLTTLGRRAAANSARQPMDLSPVASSLSSSRDASLAASSVSVASPITSLQYGSPGGLRSSRAWSRDTEISRYKSPIRMSKPVETHLIEFTVATSVGGASEVITPSGASEVIAPAAARNSQLSDYGTKGLSPAKCKAHGADGFVERASPHQLEHQERARQAEPHAAQPVDVRVVDHDRPLALAADLEAEAKAEAKAEAEPAEVELEMMSPLVVQEPTLSKDCTPEKEEEASTENPGLESPSLSAGDIKAHLDLAFPEPLEPPLEPGSAEAILARLNEHFPNEAPLLSEDLQEHLQEQSVQASRKRSVDSSGSATPESIRTTSQMATNWTHPTDLPTLVSGDADDGSWIDEEMLKLLRSVWTAAQDLVQSLDDPAAVRLAKGTEPDFRLFPGYDPLLETDLHKLVMEEMKQFEAVRTTILVKQRSFEERLVSGEIGEPIRERISEQRMAHERKRAVKQLPRQMELFTMALFAHRLKISALKERAVAAIAAREEAAERYSWEAGDYNRQLQEVREIISVTGRPETSGLFEEPSKNVLLLPSGVQAQSRLSPTPDDDQAEMQDCFAEFRQMMAGGKDTTVDAVFPSRLVSSKMSEAHCLLAAEAAHRCKTVLAAGELRLAAVHAATLLRTQRVVQTDAVLKAQVQLLDRLPALEASARQVLKDLRACADGQATDGEMLQQKVKVKEDEAVFAQALATHMKAQMELAGRLVSSPRCNGLLLICVRSCAALTVL